MSRVEKEGRRGRRGGERNEKRERKMEEAARQTKSIGKLF